MLFFARSISLRAAGILGPGVTGRVLASFERVCDLVTDGGAVVALVWGETGNGPLNAVLKDGLGAILPAGARFTVARRGNDDRNEVIASASRRVMLVSGRPAPSLQVDLSAATLWDPRPDWELLRMCRQQVVAGAGVIAGMLAESGCSPERCGLPERLCTQAARGQPSAITDLVGLGPGLTPAGDDWLAGWLLARHLGAGLTDLRTLSDLIRMTAAERTTTLSRALLECAAAGEADEAWHALLAAFMGGEAIERIMVLAHRILGHGATSGAAMLTGFAAGMALPDA